jgi:hypothetical protein
VQPVIGVATGLETEAEEPLAHFERVPQQDPVTDIHQKMHALFERRGIEGVLLAVQDDRLRRAQGEHQVRERFGKARNRAVEGVAEAPALQHAQQQGRPLPFGEELTRQVQHPAHLCGRDLVEVDSLQALRERRRRLAGG